MTEPKGESNFEKILNINIDVTGVDKSYYEKYKDNLKYFLDQLDRSYLNEALKKIKDKMQELIDEDKDDSNEFLELESFNEAIKNLDSLKELKNWDKVIARLAKKQVKQGGLDIKTSIENVHGDKKYGSGVMSDKDKLLNQAIGNLTHAIDRLLIISQYPGSDIESAIDEIRRTASAKINK